MWDFRHPAKKSPGLQEEAKLRSEIKWPLGLSPSLPPSSVARQKSEFQGNAFSCFHRFLILRYEKLETEDPERRRQEAAVEELVRINHKIVRIQLLFSSFSCELFKAYSLLPFWSFWSFFDNMMTWSFRTSWSVRSQKRTSSRQPALRMRWLLLHLHCYSSLQFFREVKMVDMNVFPRHSEWFAE